MSSNEAVFRRGVRPVIVLGLLLAAAPAAAKVASWTKTTNPQPGVEVREGRTTDDKNDIYALLVTLCTDHLHVDATAPPSKFTTSASWAGAVGAQVAVNGDFFKSGPSVYGDAAGGGQHWPASKTGVDDSGEWYYRKHGWIAFGSGWVEFSHTKAVKQGGGVTFGWEPTKVVTTIPTGTQALVSGFPELVTEGKLYTCSSPTASDCFPDRSDMRARHPRTAMGLSEDRRTFILAVVDGRKTSSIGMYGTELAALMHELGAWVAFNLDGGGSSQMWVQGRGTINDPSDGSPRAVANHWGVFAGAAGGKPKAAGSCFVAGGCYAAPIPGASGAPFADMLASDTGHDEAALLLERKIADGCSSDPLLYCPKCTITRRQLVTFLVRAAKLDTANPPATPTFADVPAEDPDYALIEAAAAAKITSGCSDGLFCPNDPVKRAAGAALVRRAAGLTLVAEKEPSTFADVPASHVFHREVESLEAACVAGGCGDGNFCPDNKVNRARAAIWIVKAFNLDGENDCLSGGRPQDGGPTATDGGAQPGGDGGSPAGRDGAAARPGDDEVSGGCCRLPGSGGGSPAPMLLLVALWWLLRRRR